MAIFGNRGVKHFFITQFISLQIYLIFLCLILVLDYYTIHFWYCLPLIIFLMFLYYFLFWRPQNDRTMCFVAINSVFSILPMAIFFGLFFGLFGSTIGFKFEKAVDCQVIGKSSKAFYGAENYSLLYVDFQLDGETLLGYGCLSDQYDSTAGLGLIKPYQFYTSETQFPCTSNRNRLLDEINLSSDTQIEKKIRKNQDNYVNISSDVASGCFQRFDFSEVKLPSWMCLPQETNYEQLIEKKTCYVNFFSLNNDFEEHTAYQNSINRSEIKKQKDFALISFKRFPVPDVGFILFLVFCFCPWILSTNLIFVSLAWTLQDQIFKLKRRYNRIEYFNKTNYLR